MCSSLPIHTGIMTSIIIGLYHLLTPYPAFSQTSGYYSDDLEAYGGASGAYSGGGTGAATNIEAIRTSPALIALQDDYRIGGSYHWPAYGRSFYQVGVVDGTSPIKAGVLYTAPRDRIYDDDPLENPSLRVQSTTDLQDLLWGMSTIQKVNLSLAQAFGKVAVGITGAYIDGMKRPYRSFKLAQTTGVTIGFGLAAQLPAGLTMAAAVENLNNQDLVDLAPTIYRLGISGFAYKDIARLHGDYLRRERVRSEWTLIKPKTARDQPQWQSLFEQRPSLSAYEHSFVGGIELTLENTLKLIGSYRHEIGTHGLDRQGFSGGIAIISGIYEITYTIKQAHRQHQRLHQTASLNFSFDLGSSDYQPSP